MADLTPALRHRLAQIELSQANASRGVGRGGAISGGLSLKGALKNIGKEAHKYAKEQKVLSKALANVNPHLAAAAEMHGYGMHHPVHHTAKFYKNHPHYHGSGIPDEDDEAFYGGRNESEWQKYEHSDFSTALYRVHQMYPHFTPIQARKAALAEVEKSYRASQNAIYRGEYRPYSSRTHVVHAAHEYPPSHHAHHAHHAHLLAQHNALHREHGGAISGGRKNTWTEWLGENKHLIDSTWANVEHHNPGVPRSALRKVVMDSLSAVYHSQK